MRLASVLLLSILLQGCRSNSSLIPSFVGQSHRFSHFSPLSEHENGNAIETSRLEDSSSQQIQLTSHLQIKNADKIESVLNLDELVLLALANNPTIPQAKSLVAQQQGLTVQSGLYPNPQLGYLRSDPSRSDKSRTSGVFLSQELVTAGKLKLAQQAGRYDVALRQWQVNAQEQRVVNDVRIRFYELLSAQRSFRITQELVNSAQEGISIASAMVEARQGTKPDVLLAEMQHSMAKGLEKNANLRLEAARRSLANAIGIECLPEGQAAENDEVAFEELRWEECLEQLYAASPLLQSQRAELQAAKTEIQLAQAQAIPNLTVQSVAQRDTTEKYNNIGILVAAPVPLFNKNQGNIHNAYGILAQQIREYERLKLAMSDQLNSSFQRYQSLHAEQIRLKTYVIPRADEYLKLTAEAHRAGRLDFARLLESKKLLFQSKLSLVDTTYELHKTLVEIDGLQLTGGLNPTEVGTALQSSPGFTGNGTRGVLMQQLDSQKNSSSRNLPGAIQAGDF